MLKENKLYSLANPGVMSKDSSMTSLLSGDHQNLSPPINLLSGPVLQH